MTVHSYGVTQQEDNGDRTYNVHCERVKRNGYTVLDSGFSDGKLKKLDMAIDAARLEYSNLYTYATLKGIEEHNTVRAPFLLSPIFFEISMNKNLNSAIKSIMGPNYIINQQNIIINPSKENYNQGLWHRDLPYQHFTISRPIALNALFCVNDFRRDNGATFVLPSSHQSERFPSDSFIKENEIQITAKRGQFILIDSMLYHKGGENKSSKERVAVNNVFSSPMIRRQIDVGKNEFEYSLECLDEEIIQKLGLNFETFKGVGNFLRSRNK
jgi:hypothetical protein